MNTESVVEQPTTDPEPPPAPPARPIDPAVLALLEQGRRIQEKVGTIRLNLREVIDHLVEQFPGYKKQISDVLEGEHQRLAHEVYQEQQEAKRNGSR